jgi:predicted Zn-dependent protease
MVLDSVSVNNASSERSSDSEEEGSEYDAEDAAAASADEEATEAFEEEPAEEEYFTETLARIYIKQGRYQKAHDIIGRLSKQYPQKNVYFADQMRFLEKLIINNNKKQK